MMKPFKPIARTLGLVVLFAFTSSAHARLFGWCCTDLELGVETDGVASGSALVVTIKEAKVRVVCENVNANDGSNYNYIESEGNTGSEVLQVNLDDEDCIKSQNSCTGIVEKELDKYDNPDSPEFTDLCLQYNNKQVVRESAIADEVKVEYLVDKNGNVKKQGEGICLYAGERDELSKVPSREPMICTYREARPNKF
jgi:hypothetical protein